MKGLLASERVPARVMSPHVSFHLDTKGYERCAYLLEAAGMQFAEERRESYESHPPLPEFTSASGQLISQFGTFACRLVACRDKYHFYVTVHGDKASIVGVLDDLERAFAGHLIGRE